jgi:hypothetical protein
MDNDWNGGCGRVFRVKPAHGLIELTEVGFGNALFRCRIALALDHEEGAGWQRPEVIGFPDAGF